MITDIKAKIDAIAAGGSGDMDYLRMTRIGQLLTADWKYNLAKEGVAWSFHIGTLTTGADVGLITGGGAGTTIDSDEPEMLIGVDAGYYLIPMECRVTCNVDMDADAEYGSIVLFADRTQAPPTSATGTPGVITGNNLLDGGSAFPGRAYGGVTTALTDPLMSELLDYEYLRVSDNGTAGSAAVERLKMMYDAQIPRLLAGPCEICMCYGGTAAVTGMASIVVAAVPTSWFS